MLATSVASYAVEGRIGAPSLLGALTCTVLAVALGVRGHRAPSAGRLT